MRDDRRAQVMQVGAVVLVGVAIVALSVYQVTSVPQQNRRVEAAHSAQIDEQLHHLRQAILETATTGTPHSALVALGVEYPGRLVAVNPAPAEGTLRTTTPGPSASVSISNATAVGPETADYWNGSERSFETRAVSYLPDYNEFENAPITVYDDSLLYALYGVDPLAQPATVSGGETLSNQTVIEGKRITVVTVEGSLSRTGSENVSVAARPVSVSNTTVRLANAAGERVSLTLPTRATNESWQQVLEPELRNNGGSIDSFSCSAGSDDESCGTLSITLSPTDRSDPYVLRMAKIGVGNGASEEPPRYLTNVTDERVRVPENESRKLVLEVRDRYNNPVAGESVNLTIVDRSVLQRLADDGERVDVGELRTDGDRGTGIEATTNERGRVAVQYTAPRSVNGSEGRNLTVFANRTAQPDPTADRESANSTDFNVTVANTDASPVAHTVRWNESAFASQPGVQCGPQRCLYNRSAGRLTIPITALAAGSNDSVSGVDVAFANRDPGVLRYVSADDVTNEAGRATATISIVRPGTTTLAVAGGENSVGGDRLTLTIANQVPNAAGVYRPRNATSGTPVQFDGRPSGDPDGRVTGYEWDFGDGTSGFGSRPRHVYNRSGTYNATLTVTDEFGAEDTTTAVVEIANRPPEAAFEYPLTVPAPGEALTFDASGSIDPDGEIRRYEWDFGDGSSDTSSDLPTTSHAYDEPGTYVVSLRVTDDDGDTDVIRKTVTVSGE